MRSVGNPGVQRDCEKKRQADGRGGDGELQTNSSDRKVCMEMVASFPLKGKEGCKKRRGAGLSARSMWSPYNTREVNKRGDLFLSFGRCCFRMHLAPSSVPLTCLFW